MKYDLSNIILEQINQMLTFLNQNNLLSAKDALDNLYELVDDIKFKEEITDYQNVFNARLDKLETDTLNIIRDITKIKTMDDIVNCLQQANDVSLSINKEFFATIKKYVIKYFQVKG